jgi:hypothetical protein
VLLQTRQTCVYLLFWHPSAALTVVVRRSWLGSHLGNMPQP